MMNKYEIMFIVKPDMEEKAIKAEADNMKKVLTDKKAKIIEEKAMGQREEFSRVARINENLLRHLIVKVEE